MASNQPTNKELLLLNNQKLDALIETVGGLSADIKNQGERIHGLDKKQATNCANIKNLKEDVKTLENKVNNWSILNSIGALIAAIMAGLGITKGS